METSEFGGWGESISIPTSHPTQKLSQAGSRPHNKNENYKALEENQRVT